MAERQRRPAREQERQGEATQLINQVRDLTERVRNVPLTPVQREVLITALEELARAVTRLPVVIPRNLPTSQTARGGRTETERSAETEERRRVIQPSEAQQQAPLGRTRPAPSRVQQYQYRIAVGGTSYLVTLPERLPTTRSGAVDALAAQGRLFDLLLNNELVRTDPRNPNIIHQSAQVTMEGTGPQVTAFNNGTPNYRLDVFRDSYLGRTSSGGQFAQSREVTIAEVVLPAGRRSR